MVIKFQRKKNDNKTDHIFTEKPEITENDLEMISTNLSKPGNDYKYIIYKIIDTICNKAKEKKAMKAEIIEKAKQFGIDLIRVEDGIERLIRSKKISGNEDQYYIIK